MEIPSKASLKHTVTWSVMDKKEKCGKTFQYFNRHVRLMAKRSFSIGT
jgi:hypothetical protein